jgi:raffinose/stachyose/melibiose transport system permease protein
MKTDKPKRKVPFWLHLFPVPALLMYTIFMLVPVFTALGYSLFNWNGMQRGQYIGLKNFVTLFTDQQIRPLFFHALSHNIYYFVLSLVIQNVLAFYFSYLIYIRLRGHKVFKILFFIPRLLALVVVGLLWNLMLNPNLGAVNTLLKMIGLGSLAKTWLGDTSTALTSIILVQAWFMIGFGMLIYLAGLQSVPSEVLEAAELDGCTGLNRIRKVILPLLTPSITIMTVLTFIYSFEAFDLIVAMEGSNGGPFYSTDTLTTLFYRLSFSADGATSSVGIGSALAVVMFVILATVSALFLIFFNRRHVEY